MTKYNPQVLHTWKDRADIETTVYELPHGLKVVLCQNPHSNRFDFSLVMNAGSFYETQLGMKHGTAHLLEHVIYNAPNELVANYQEEYEYRAGDRSKPYISANATTSQKYMYLYAHGHHEAAIRMVDLVIAKLQAKFATDKDTFAKQKEIVIHEIARKLEPSRDSALQFDKKFFEDFMPEFTYRVVGEVESVQAITLEEIKQYYDAVVSTRNMVVAIQTIGGTSLDEQIWDRLYKLDASLPDKEVKFTRDFSVYPDKFRVGYFTDINNNSTFISVNMYYHHIFGKYDRVLYRKYGLISSMLNKVGYDYLREETGLVYNVETFNSLEMWSTKNRGFGLTINPNRFLETLDAAYDFLYDKCDEFLYSPKAKLWLEDNVSAYVFPGVPAYDADYAEEIAADVVLGDPTYHLGYDFEQTKQIMLDMKIEDLQSFWEEFIKISPVIWFNSPRSQPEIEEIFHQSKFWKQFGTTS